VERVRGAALNQTLPEKNRYLLIGAGGGGGGDEGDGGGRGGYGGGGGDGGGDGGGGSNGEGDDECTRADCVTVVSVEQLALVHYASVEGGGWRGVHSEGAVWRTLFGLLFADVLLEAPRGVPTRAVFRSPFQSGPLDLCTADFLPRRRRAVTSRLADIRGGAASGLLTNAWTAHYGSALRGVHWTLLTLEEVRDVAAGLGGAALADVCALMVRRCRLNR